MEYKKKNNEETKHGTEAIRVLFYLENGDQRAIQKVLQNLVHLPCQTWTILPKQILHVIHQGASQIRFPLPQFGLATFYKIIIVSFSHSNLLMEQELLHQYKIAPYPLQAK